MSTASLARQMLKASSRAYDRTRAPREGITILIYHRVGATSGGQMNIDPAMFERQIEWLGAHHRVISLDTAVEEIASGIEVRPGVALTFDDGTEDWATIVGPLLVKHKIPATFYLTSGYANGDLRLPDNEPAITWSGARTLIETGMACIGSHTHTHRLLDRLDANEVDRELDTSIELIGSHLGISVDHFCYPKALDPSPTAHAAVSARFQSASLAGTRANVKGDDVFRLHRSPIQAADTFEDFVRKANGGMGFEDDVRRVANRVRYRGKAS